MIEAYVNRGQRKIFFNIIKGNYRRGRTILWLHSLASDSTMWAPQIEYFKKLGYDLVTIDMRGHGRSEALGDKYIVTDLAEDVERVILELNLEDVVIVGLSIGGVIAQAIGVRRPKWLDALVLCSTFRKTIREMDLVWDRRMEEAKRKGSLHSLADESIKRWVTNKWIEEERDLYNKLLASVERTSVQGFCGGVEALKEFDFTDDYNKINCPTLVICGELDESALPIWNQKIAKSVAKGEYYEMLGCKHMPNLERAGEFNKTLEDWFERVLV